jgi:ribosomal protein S27E
MSIKNIPAHNVVTCDHCGRTCQPDGPAARLGKATVAIDAQAHTIFDNPLLRNHELCDACANLLVVFLTPPDQESHT